jgi:hypothetical protein
LDVVFYAGGGAWKLCLFWSAMRNHDEANNYVLSAPGGESENDEIEDFAALLVSWGTVYLSSISGPSCRKLRCVRES